MAIDDAGPRVLHGRGDGLCDAAGAGLACHDRHVADGPHAIAHPVAVLDIAVLF